MGSEGHRQHDASIVIDRAADFDLLQRLNSLRAQFRNGRDVTKLMRAALMLALDFFHAPEGCIAMLPPGRDEVEIVYSTPRSAEWDCQRLARFVRGEAVGVREYQMASRLRLRGRSWGVIVVRAPGADYRWDARRALSSVATATVDIAERIDLERIRDVRARIDRKIMEQIRPKDLFYQILHGIRSLTHYDHSAALLTCDEGMSHLELVAEQVAWRKGKSRRIGLALELTDEIRAHMATERVFGVDLHQGSWQAWSEHDASALAELLDFNRRGTDGETDERGQAERAMLCAPLVTKHGVLGVLKVAAEHPGTFGAYEAELISRFVPQAAVAIQNSQWAESMQEQVLSAERKHAMADLARGVSHDVNNALGSVLPLIQQMRSDLDDEGFEPGVAKEDLREIERSLQVCRRIFGGMLNFARGVASTSSEVFLHHEVETTLAILREGMNRQGIAVTVDVPRDLPPVKGVQADVEQLLLNLLTNARDAMPDGGELSIRAGRCDHGLEVEITDTGSGISSSDLAKIYEPFFTTKPTGTGLGLAICRSILAQMGGQLEVDSELGRGTCVKLEVGAAGDGDR